MFNGISLEEDKGDMESKLVLDAPESPSKEESTNNFVEDFIKS